MKSYQDIQSDEHSFSSILATHTSVKKALILKYLYERTFLFSHPDNAVDNYWIKATAKEIHEYFPYISIKTVSRKLNELENEYWIVSLTSNENPCDMGKKYMLNIDRYKNLVFYGMQMPTYSCKMWAYNAIFSEHQNESPITPHSRFPIRWNGFPMAKSKKLKGVYMIGDNVYVGASKHIRRRIIQHCCDAMSQYYNPFIFSDNCLKRHIQEVFTNQEALDVYFLSPDPYDEKMFIENLRPLANSPKGRTYDELY